MSLKGLENAIRNLNSLDRHMVPQASAWAVNRVAASAVSAATHRVAKEAVAGDNQKKGIPFRLVKQRVKLWKASATGKNYARIRYVYDRGVDGSGRCGADAGTKT